jgi:Arc/MetJ family transcription regulator
MATNLALDDRLINEALKAGHHRSKKEAVTEALRKYINSLKQQDVLASFGKINFEKDYDYKKGRKR